MNTAFCTLLRTARFMHRRFWPDTALSLRIPVKQVANGYISQMLNRSHPCMVARLGATELSCLANYVGVRSQPSGRRIIPFVQSKAPAWWWEQNIIDQMQQWSGFFPPEIEPLERFCELMIKDMPEVDLLGSWLKEEDMFSKELGGAKRVTLEDLEPFFTPEPWTWALAGKRVVVVHPFASSIEEQYRKRSLLFDNGLLPDFDLRTVRAVQTLGKASDQFADWFAALDWMKREIDKLDYDVCIIGCGAYGFPLAAHVKRQGRKAVHLAGATQLLFGIRGNRWEGYVKYPYQNLFNRHWIRPGSSETPPSAGAVENACYW